MIPAPALALSTSPAQTLVESGPRLQLQPLSPDSTLYTPLEKGRATRELDKLALFLHNAAATPNAWAKCAFVGNRGSGKSTFLLHMEQELEREGLFTPIHIYLDQSLESDCDYSALILWTVEEIARQFKERGHPVDEGELSRVTLWFAETSLAHTTDWKKELGIETQAQASGGFSLPAILSLKVLVRLKSMISGSETSRKEIRHQLQNHRSDLRERADTFLDHARSILVAADKPERLLIIHDNLDRIKDPGVARHLFIDDGDALMDLRADLIYTAPLALKIAPHDITRTFGHVFTMPNVKVRLRNGKPHKPGIDNLVQLVAKRMDIQRVFENEKVVRYLADKSGGSVSDLLRLLNEAQLNAQLDGHQRIDMPAAKAAVQKTSLHYLRLLRPASVYLPILADIHRHKGEFSPAGPGPSSVASVADARAFFAELIDNRAVLEYNGDDVWYDVNPAIIDTAAFKHALTQASNSAPTAP
jgi:energy-coupling factor transporter ATP-binding protein EcfA2